MNRLAALAVACVSLSAQSTPPTPAEQKRLAYYEAYRAWREADPDLERDLATAPAEQLHQRIADASAKAAAYTSARTQYYLEMLGGYSEANAKLAGPNVKPVVEDIVIAVKRQQSVVAAQIDAIGKEVDALAASPDKELQRHAADRQWAALTAIQSNLTQQLNSLEQGANKGTASEALRKTLLEHYQVASALLRQEITFTEREAGLWRSYYASLSRAVDGRKPASANAIPAAPPNGAKARAADPAAESWAGNWVFDPAKEKSYSANQPESVTLHLEVASGIITGTYEAHYKLPKRSHAQPRVWFEFSGPIAPGDRQRIAVHAAGNFNGTIELRHVMANAVEVVWRRTAAGKELSFGEEVLYKR